MLSYVLVKDPPLYVGVLVQLRAVHATHTLALERCRTTGWTYRRKLNFTTNDVIRERDGTVTEGSAFNVFVYPVIRFRPLVLGLNVYVLQARKHIMVTIRSGLFTARTAPQMKL